ncbi:unnamed protein product [Pieris brassicae]|uniref:Ionotropic glutamate receptor C-terminal domain-containing protein n=1 Tax=Pieris brassicae TaxID=7116 RepID=A0A9P0TAZ0_PIEBR|nr:unnamed protein product [Pieris brassicae]
MQPTSNEITSGSINEHKTNEDCKAVAPKYFSNWYKWIILADDIPDALNKVRYDADIILIKPGQYEADGGLEDVYIHPYLGASVHPWAFHNNSDLYVTYEKERILRRLNLHHYPLRIATPLATYSNDSYNGTFIDYLHDMSMPERDSGVRCGYTTSSLIVESLNARVGFTYLAERESSNNMFVAPFTTAVWLCCLALFAILFLAQRVTAKSVMEKEGAYIAVLATCLQQDASAVPQGISGRWTFLVLSICAMLIHAYYTSAIVSALMSTGRSGPDSLKSLGDSRYAIASEDYDYMRYLMFDVPTNWDDLEYLKRKKITSKFYQDIRDGVRLIQAGQTAYHTEYNQLYPHLRVFTDDQLCKLQYIDTVPETLSWITTTKRGQWTEVLKSSGAWLHETGLAKQLVSRLRIKPPPCRAALLAERVNIYDVTPLLGITIAAVILSVIILRIELLLGKRKAMASKNNKQDIFDS